MRPPLVVWQFADGKAGHESQSRGLVEALARRTPVHAYRIPVSSCRCGLGSLLRRHHPCSHDFPPPDLLIACGRTTHFVALAVRRACGGKLVSVMKPYLPASLFDLILVPEHDRAAAAANILRTRGALNTVQPTPMTPARQGRGLMLIGGPSIHHRWDGNRLVGSVVDALHCDGSRTWTLTTSRRTPTGFIEQLRTAVDSTEFAVTSDGTQHPRLAIVPIEETRPGWVANHLANSDAALVTEDSVSMIYESLTSGVRVGLLPMPVRRLSRVARGVEQLCQSGQVELLSDFLNAPHRGPNAAPLAEADRCAEAILNRWFSGDVPVVVDRAG